MKKLMISVLTGLFLMSLGSVSLAEMLDKLKGKAEKAKQEASETMGNKEASETMESQEAAPEKSIEAQDATKEESSGMMDKAKETVKEAVEEKKGGLGK